MTWETSETTETRTPPEAMAPAAATTGTSHEHFSTPPAECPSSSVLEKASQLLRALSSPTRLGIVVQLEQSPRCVHELVDTLGASQPLVSQHLRVLKECNVVVGQRQGREIVYRLVDHHLSHIVADALAHAAEEDGGSSYGKAPA